MAVIDWHQRAQEIEFSNSHFIAGNQVDMVKKGSIEKYSPRDGRLLYTLPFGTPEEMEYAIASAQQAYRDKRWRGLGLSQRQEVLCRLADLMDIHHETLALYESLETGKPISQALSEVIQAGAILRETVKNACKLSSFCFSDGSYSAYHLNKPMGIVGAIISWNFPLMLAALKIGPALIMGNSLVLKPSEYASASTGYLAALALEAGVPPGILNVVNGVGHTVGSTLAHHTDVALLSFTGSSSTGKKMQIAAGQSNMKRLLLECGGKSPYIIFDDCPTDLDWLASDIVSSAFHNQGQNCLAGSRLLIQKSIKERLLPKVVDQAAKIFPQDSLNPDSNFGALIHESHLNKVLSYIDSGEQEGAKLILGGNRVHVDTGSKYSEGFYVEPTIFDEVSATHKIAQEEMLGPVLSVLTFSGEQEAIDLSNNSRYGLGAYIATENISRAERLIKEINAGYIQIISTSSPNECYQDIGKEGLRESGFGAEGGLQGLLSYSSNIAVHQWM